MNSIKAKLTLAVLLGLCACATRGLDFRVAVEEANGNFTLYVSNQDLTTPLVDIVASVDGRLLVSGEFKVNHQHHWTAYSVKLPRGQHTIQAVAAKGSASLTKSFEVSGRHWATLIYWGARGDDAPHQKTGLEFAVSDEPIGFL
jgi:hypothetical protein